VSRSAPAPPQPGEPPTGSLPDPTPPPPRVRAEDLRRDRTLRGARHRRLVPFAIVLGLAAIAIWSTVALEIRPTRLGGIANLFTLMREAFPPDAALAPLAFRAIVETLQIAFLGTLIGAVFSLPLGLFGSRNLFGRGVTVPSRLLLAGVRTLPALLWAVVFVVAVGLGPLAGVLASATYTVGYLGKLQYEAIEGMDPAPIHAITAAGASKAQLIRYVVIPESANHLLSQMLFMFEHNVRASSIFGFVGAGGIGFYIAGYLTVFRYQSVFTLLIAVFLTILAIDYLSVRLRDRFLVPAHAERARRN
jgi:phosphonate transport system permease protein